MARFQVINMLSGVDCGIFEGENPDDVLENIARRAGYASNAEAEADPLLPPRNLQILLFTRLSDYCPA